MTREKALIKFLDELNLFYSDLNRLILQYDKEPIEFQINGKYMFEWKCPEEKVHDFQNIVQDNQTLLINCIEQNEIYRYSFDGNLVNTLQYYALAMEIVHTQLYLLDDKNFFILNLQTNSMIESWDLPKEEGDLIGGVSLKVDRENIYFAPFYSLSHYVYLYSKKGKEIDKFGSKNESEADGEFYCPRGIAVDEEYLYVCDSYNDRVQVVDKKNGTFICQWKNGQRSIYYPLSILWYEHLFYVGDRYGVQVFTKQGKCNQVFGISKDGSGKGEFDVVTGLCMVNDKLYIVDCCNSRIQVWS